MIVRMWSYGVADYREGEGYPVVCLATGEVVKYSESIRAARLLAEALERDAIARANGWITEVLWRLDNKGPFVQHLLSELSCRYAFELSGRQRIALARIYAEVTGGHPGTSAYAEAKQNAIERLRGN